MNPSTKKIDPVLRRALRRRLRREGMTLIEIMIVVIIMALIATAVGFAVLPQLQRSRITTARTDAVAVRSGAELYFAQDPSADCPSVTDLVEADILNSNTRTVDPWNNDFVIECDGDDIMVVSGGPDGDVGTEDDVR